jgi:hypothetical protein
MTNAKRPVRQVKSFRVNWATIEFLARISKQTGWSEGTIVEIAVAEFFRNHPEYWPPEKGQEDQQHG